MVIGVDMDDVLLDFTEHLLRFVNAKYGTNHQRKDSFNFNLEHVWKVPKEDVDRKILEFYSSKEHNEAPPFPEALDGIRELKAAGHELHLITSKPDILKDVTLRWLRTHFSDAFSDAHFMNEFHGTGAKRTKAEVCKLLGVEIFIDDALHNARSISATGIPVLLLDAPWNQEKVEAPITRVKSWKDIVEIIQLLTKA
jgi:uncharacterized HAD superfamily protein